MTRISVATLTLSKPSVVSKSSTVSSFPAPCISVGYTCRRSKRILPPAPPSMSYTEILLSRLPVVEEGDGPDIHRLKKLISAGLGNVPQNLITPAQHAAAMAGQTVTPTDAQTRAHLALEKLYGVGAVAEQDGTEEWIGGEAQTDLVDILSNIGTSGTSATGY